jgi:hypothetical protein
MILTVVMLAAPTGTDAPSLASPSEPSPDFSITGYHMAVSVQADGSDLVTEALTYHFESPYNGILGSFDMSGTDGIQDLKLYVDGVRQLSRVDEMRMEPLTFTLTKDGELVNIKAYAPGDAGDRAFRYEYRVKGLARRYLDAGRINRKLIGTQNQVPLEGAVVTVTFPGSGGPGHYFAHGAMGAVDLRLEDGELTMGPRTVRPGEFVELDALFPAGWLKDAPVIPENVLADALRTEADIAARAGVVQPTGYYFSDYASILNDEAKRHIEVNAKALDDATGAQIVFVTLGTTSPMDIRDYAMQLFNSWGIGDREKDNGILVLLAIGDDDYYIMEGIGLEESLPVSELRAMWNETLEPDFARKDYSSACVKFFDALFLRLDGMYGAGLELRP